MRKQEALTPFSSVMEHSQYDMKRKSFFMKRRVVRYFTVAVGVVKVKTDQKPGIL